MGNACKASFQDKAIVESVYPKTGSNVNEGNLSKLTMHALQSQIKLIIIVKRLEQNVRYDIQRKRHDRVLVGCKIFDKITVTNNADIIQFIVNTLNVIKLLFEQNDPNLMIKATETLNILLGNMKDNKSNMIVFLEPVTKLLSYNNNNVQYKLKVRAAAMKTIETMIATMDVQLFDADKLAKLIPGLVENINAPTQSGAPASSSTPSAAVASLVEDTGASSSAQYTEDEPEIDTNRSLIDTAVSLTPAHVSRAAKDTLAAIALAIPATSVKNVVKPVLEVLEQKKWTPFEYSKTLMTIMLRSAGLHSYILASAVIHFLEFKMNLSEAEKVCMLQLINYVIESQNNKGAVGVRALEALSSFLKFLLSSNENEQQFREFIMICIKTMARKGQHTSQNLDIMVSILSLIKKQRDENAVLTLLRVILNVCMYPSTVPAGKFYPDHLTKQLFEESLNSKPKPREYICQVFQSILKGQQKAPSAGASSTATTVEPSENLEGGSSKTQQSSSSTGKTIAVLSKKQREELHQTLFKGILLNNNGPYNFIEIFKTFFILLKQYKKDLEFSIPLMFKLQEICSGNEKQIANSNSVQTLILGYFYYISLIYNNNEIEKEVRAVYEKREASNQIRKGFLDVLKNSFLSDKIEEPKELELAFTSGLYDPVSQDNLLNRDALLNILCNIESLKQSYEDIRNVFSKNYNSDVFANVSIQPKKNVSTNGFEPNEDPFDVEWMNDQDSDGTDTIPEIKEEIKLTAEDVRLKDFTMIGQAAAMNEQHSQRVLEKILDIVPKARMGELDLQLDEDLEDLDDEEEVQDHKEEDATHMDSMARKLFVFDSPVFIKV